MDQQRKGRSVKRVIFLYDGVWDTYWGHAERLGVKMETMRTRLKRFGKGPEARQRVLSTGRLGARRKVLWKGVWATVDEHADRLGINRETLQTRIKRYGCTAETLPKLLYAGRLGRVAFKDGEWKRLTRECELKGRVRRKGVKGYGHFHDSTRISLKSLGVIV